ncbi:hypothetical protein VTK26DRAFT_4238 [Humicola hyalothermophila]
MTSTTPPKTMKAWQFTATTPNIDKHLVLNPSAPVPTLSTGRCDAELLIQVLSAGLNPVDYKLPESGLLGRAMIRLPGTPSQDFCGRVVQATQAVDDFAIGDLVFGRIDPQQHGSCAEYIVAPTKACARVPEGVGVDEAAAAGVAGLTAYRA